MFASKNHCLTLVFAALSSVCAQSVGATTVSTPYGRSVQVNVDAHGQNIPADPANESTLCINPTNSALMAIGWRQFDTTNSSFRQSGVSYSM